MKFSCKISRQQPSLQAKAEYTRPGRLSEKQSYSDFGHYNMKGLMLKSQAFSLKKYVLFRKKSDFQTPHKQTN